MRKLFILTIYIDKTEYLPHEWLFLIPRTFMYPHLDGLGNDKEEKEKKATEEEKKKEKTTTTEDDDSRTVTISFGVHAIRIKNLPNVVKYKISKKSLESLSGRVIGFGSDRLVTAM